MAQLIVGIGDAKMSKLPVDQIITYSLGSCLGITIYDPGSKIGGMIHLMLPDSGIESFNRTINPYKYVDTGIPLIFNQLQKMGLDRKRAVIKVAGASQLLDSKGIFNIGKKNYEALQTILAKDQLRITASDIGGTINRTMTLNIDTGRVVLKCSNQEIKDL
ncbi:MAG: chemotaxis protein CheD [Candidatus Delongbacteria bacterium]|nr:chemotaxis protein CheD [Candidatus Delongbacteria bacterium]